VETSTEQIISLAVINPNNGVEARCRFKGKIDRVEESKIIDWKGVAKVDRFITRSRIGYQGELYTLAKQAANVAIDEIEYRLIARPTIRMYVKDEKESKETGLPVPEVYENRCLKWLLGDPAKMTTHNYPIHSAKLEQAEWYLWESSRRLLENRRCDRWIPNTHACFAWERECQYIPLCDAVQNGADVEWLIDSGYRVLDNSHPELGDEGKGNIITYSSLGDLHLCEMIYFWAHERRLRKGVGEDSEALWIGNAMHAGMEKIDEGPEAARLAVTGWADRNPVLGEKDNHMQEQQVARANAMIRAAAIKWPMEMPNYEIGVDMAAGPDMSMRDGIVDQPDHDDHNAPDDD